MLHDPFMIVSTRSAGNREKKKERFKNPSLGQIVAKAFASGLDRDDTEVKDELCGAPLLFI